MYLKTEDSIRGGISMIVNKYSKANNKYLRSYDKNKPSTYIIYLDANNLYGWAMSQPLPFGDYKYEKNVDIFTKNYIMNLKDDSDRGYFLNVDLEYPQTLHDLHNDYPLAPERKIVTKDMLSNKVRSLMNVASEKQTKCDKPKDNSKGDKVPKLICDFNETINYGVHYRTLKLYLSLGMKLKNVHSVISYKQSTWLEEYISFNTKKRALAKNKFEKDFFKLMNNAVFGKTMENVRNCINKVLINNDIKRVKNIQQNQIIKNILFLMIPILKKIQN